ncbi:MAG: cation diffusion facilitator family transporter [Candidatus Binatia bacterium]|nr:cation diffusion facilitator family transporter [Candidatus Binatia bacterium]
MPDFATFLASRLYTRRQAILLSVAVGLVLLLVKFTAATLTGSAAILSDALESIINVVASAFAYYSIRVSAQPPDPSHPYGHGKIESFSAGFEGALIILAALVILWEAFPRFFSPPLLTQLDLGLLLIFGAAAVNAALGLFLLRIGNQTGSLALIADGKHLLADVYTSVGVVIGVAAVRLTGWVLLDPLTACIVAVNILVSGVGLLRQSVGHLMDEADEAALHRIVTALQAARRPEWIDIHHLRSWRSGDRYHIDFHLTLPRYWNLEQCHAAQTDITETLRRELGEESEVLVHLDPCMSHHCSFCQMANCPVRAVPFHARPRWTVASATGNPPIRSSSAHDQSHQADRSEPPQQRERAASGCP